MKTENTLKKVTRTTPEGNTYNNYYLCYKNIQISIKPTFKQDYAKLNLIAKLLENNENE